MLTAGLAACGGPASGSPPASTSQASASSAARSPGASPGATITPPHRFTGAQDLSAAVLTAVRARGSVLITTTAEGTPLVGRRSVQLVGAGQNTASEVSMPGRPDELLLVVGEVPYVRIRDDPRGRHWRRLGFDDLLRSKVWASAVYAVDLAGELTSWALATAVRGGDAGTSAGEGVRTYTLTLGPQAAAAQVRLDRVEPAERAAAQERLARVSYDLTVALGGDDLPRTITTVAPTSGLVTTQTYSRWGEVAVPAPDPDDVVVP